MPRILHIITSLDQGGAERQISELVRADSANNAVFSLVVPGAMARQIREKGVPVYSGGGANILSIAWPKRLWGALKKWQPEIVMGWMYHGNLAASLTKQLGFRGPLLWNVRHSVSDLRLEKTTTQWVIRANAWLSSQPATIIYNSRAAAAQHSALGFAGHKGMVVANGFDVEKFQPDLDARDRLRTELRVSRHQFLVGVVGRSHAMKNHIGWLHAMQRIVRYQPNVRCLMMGAGVPNALVEIVDRMGLNPCLFLRDGVDAPEAVYPGLDLLVMPSKWGEGFPNVVGEAMACGVPALVTSIGDATEVVGGTGFLASGPEAENLASATMSALNIGMSELQQRGKLARQRIVRHFSLGKMTNRYQCLYEAALNNNTVK